MTPLGREEPIALVGRSRSTPSLAIVLGWPLLKVQRSVASPHDEWQVPAAAVIGRQNLTGCRQSAAAGLRACCLINAPTIQRRTTATRLAVVLSVSDQDWSRSHRHMIEA